jgi:flagellar protein FlgJ
MEGPFMLHTTRRLLAGPLLVAAIAGGLVATPAAANAAGVSATVSVGSTLLVRSAPSLAAKAVGALHGRQQVTVVCTVTGTKVRGSVRTTNLWDRLGTGRYISHAYVSSSRAIPSCAVASPEAETVKAKPGKVAKPAYIVGTVQSTDGRVNIRAGASTTAKRIGSVGNGEKVNLVCGVVGDLVEGTVRATTQWNRLASGNYISHAYVSTPTLHLCPGASLTKPSSSVALTPEQFIKAAVPGAQRGWREFGVPASVTIAQAILESGWGRSGLASVDKNYFGIKCFNGKYGTIANGCHVYDTSECTKAGNCFRTTASFRTYASQTNSFRDHGNFLRVNSRYQPAFAYTKDANKFIWKVWKAGYATDPNYYTKITGIMAANGLYKYDVWK